MKVLTYHIGRAGTDRKILRALQALRDGDVALAYRRADPNLALVLEAAFTDAELGLEPSSTNPHGYSLI